VEPYFFKEKVMSKRYITVKESPNVFDGEKKIRIPFFAVFSILFKIHLALLLLGSFYLLGGAILAMVLSWFGGGYNQSLNGLFF